MKKKSVLLATAIVNSAEKEIGKIPPKAKKFMISIYSQEIESIPKGESGEIFIEHVPTRRVFRTTVAA